MLAIKTDFKKKENKNDSHMYFFEWQENLELKWEEVVVVVICANNSCNNLTEFFFFFFFCVKEFSQGSA